MLHGTAIDGGLTTHEYTATAGTTWSSGGLIATYKGGSVDPIHASQRSYTDHLPEPATLYPGSDLHSGLVSAHQALGESTVLRVDALRTKRGILQYYNWAGSSHRSSNETKTSFVSPSVEFSLPNDWMLTIKIGSTECRERGCQDG